MVINYCKNENEQNMLLNLYKKKWNQGLKNVSVSESKRRSNEGLEEMARLTKEYSGWIKQENSKTIRDFSVSSIGKLDPKRHLKEVAFISASRNSRSATSYRTSGSCSTLRSSRFNVHPISLLPRCSLGFGVWGLGYRK